MSKRYFTLGGAVVLMATAVAVRAQDMAELDILRVVLGQPGTWSASAPFIGQKAGIFRKHGLALDIVAASSVGRPAHAVASGAADLGIGIDTARVLRAYAKGAPVRVIGANFTGAGDLYWYVRSDSSIQRLDDLTDKATIGFSAIGSSSHYVVLAFIRELGLRGLPIATGPQSSTLTQLMSGKVDVGWAAPPFGLKEVSEGKIRIIADGNDVPSLRTQTVRVDIVNDKALTTRNDALTRFVRAYRETLDWMFSSPQAIEIYARHSNIEPALVAMTRDKFETREAMRNDRLSGLDAVMAEAVARKFIDGPLSKEQVADLIWIPPQ